MNKKKVFDYIKSHKNCTITQISNSLKMKYPYVFAITNFLLEINAIGYSVPSLSSTVDDSALFYVKIDNFEE